MKAEILTIGDEILIGQITNTNSVWIAQQLNLMGIKIVHMASVSDNEDEIIKALEDATLRADFVFITGGLGPTKDDITKKTIAKFFNTELVINETVLKMVSDYFLKRDKKLLPTNYNQALVPKGCQVILNQNGTAPSIWMKKNNTVFICMPGVPYEMKAMMTDIILPKIKTENNLPFIYHHTVLTTGIGESALAELIADWEDKLINKNIKLAYLPQLGIVRLRLSTFGNYLEVLKKNIYSAIEELNIIIEEFIFGHENYGEESPSLEKIVSELLREKKQTLALAESCTGGYISNLFIQLPGASEIFKGAIVPYTNFSKQDLLNVDKTIFETVGAVSKECVTQLAKQVLLKFNSDYSIAISGIAGPSGGTDEKPVGTVWIAVANKEKVRALKFQFGDHRQRNIIMSANAAINLLRKFLIKINHQNNE